MFVETSRQLLISVVRRSRGDKVVALAREAGAQGSTVLFGKGTAANKWLRLLCLADTEKELVFTVAPANIMLKIEDALREAEDLCVRMPGIGIIINVEEFIRNVFRQENGSPQRQDGEEARMNEDKGAATGRVLFCIIVNAGLADDLMHVAREAGARGGTILRARGTGTDEDTSFFGISIVPEKEVLLIMTEREQQQKILEAVKSSSILSQPGVGIIFTMPVEKFFPLGKKANG